ncbi:DciA family protein [Lentisalinibacter sediminis]|uniref:DciA family protein n=1 Tax=Lentisalinibacter sediminis TaxID=2992237 RepID=UPI0038707B1F
MNEKKLGNLLSRPDSPLAGIVERARAMETLTAAVRAALSEDARAHLVSAARRDDGTLVLVTESSAWAARLRFAADEALAAARRYGVTAESVSVLVRPEREGPEHEDSGREDG